MEIVMQTIRIIDYENSEIYVRSTPEAFSEYIAQLINYINENTSVRDYRTRSVNTEVISCILDIVKNQIDEEQVTGKVDLIAKRLLLKEVEAQASVIHLNISVQKGSLIQALLYDEEKDIHIYLLAKVEHTDFVDDTDFSFKSGFSKDTKKLWKSCVIEIDDLNKESYTVKIYSNTTAKYWYDNFLELDQIVSDEVNTDRAFRAIESTLNRTVKNIAPRDHTLLRNSIISYFKSNAYIDYDILLNMLRNYQPVELEADKMNKVIEKISELPNKHKFDKQFNMVPSVINARIKKVYDVCQGIQLKITDSIEDFGDTIKAYRENDGNRYIRIKTDNDLTFRRFSN